MCSRRLTRWGSVREEQLEARRLLAYTAVEEFSHLPEQRETIFFHAQDLDGDDDTDLVLLGDDRFSVARQQLAGEFEEATEYSIGTRVLLSFQPDDFDGDGLIDLVFATAEGEFHKYRSGGDLRFDSSEVIGEFSLVDGRSSLNTAKFRDLDGDGDLDFLDAERWYENVDGRLVERDVAFTLFANIVDYEGDGDLDAVHSNRASEEPYEVVLHENRGGFEFAAPTRLIQTEGRVIPTSFDIDGDSDADLLLMSHAEFGADGSGGSPDRNFEVFRNDGGVLTRAQTGTLSVGEFFAPEIIDVDADGDPDVMLNVVSTDNVQVHQQLFWLENRSGRLETAQSIGDVLGIYLGVELTDRGQVQVKSYDNGMLRVHHIRRVGDANRDGRFDSDDLIHVSRSGHYDDGVANNSSFDEGDWNGDGEFDSSDLVFAFQHGFRF